MTTTAQTTRSELEAQLAEAQRDAATAHEAGDWSREVQAFARAQQILAALDALTLKELERNARCLSWAASEAKDSATKAKLHSEREAIVARIRALTPSSQTPAPKAAEPVDADPLDGVDDSPLDATARTSFDRPKRVYEPDGKSYTEGGVFYYLGTCPMPPEPSFGRAA